MTVVKRCVTGCGVLRLIRVVHPERLNQGLGAQECRKTADCRGYSHVFGVMLRTSEWPIGEYVGCADGVVSREATALYAVSDKTTEVGRVSECGTTYPEKIQR